MKENQSTVRGQWYSILILGSLWGAFEATVGFLLHRIPVAIGAYIWFPAAYFFIDRAQRTSRQGYTVILVALLSACIKLLNLFTQMPAEYAINPAVSIMAEGLAAAIVYFSFRKRRGKGTERVPWQTVLSINTIWRIMYVLYLSLLAPTWIGDGSIIAQAESLWAFLLYENLITSLICLAIHRLLSPRKLTFSKKETLPHWERAVVLLAVSIALQFVL